MEELLKLLDADLQYINHEIHGEEIHINVKSARAKAVCPYCDKLNSSVHSRAKRTIKDLPMCGRKVKLILENKKYFCKNAECSRKTFIERFSFFEPNATKTNRLQKEIMRVSLTQSSVSASRYLSASVANVGKSTVCNLINKGQGK